MQFDEFLLSMSANDLGDVICAYVRQHARPSVPTQTIWAFQFELRRLLPWSLWFLVLTCDEAFMPMMVVTLNAIADGRPCPLLPTEKELAYVANMRAGLQRYYRNGHLSIAWFEKATTYLHWLEKRYICDE